MSDLSAFVVFAAVLLGGVGLGEGLRVWAGWTPEATRRVVHLVTGLAVAVAPLGFDRPTLIYVLAVAFIAVNLTAVLRRWLPAMHGIERRSWGTVTFPLALVVALGLCWSLNAGRVYILQTAFLVLAFADPAASFVGGAMARPGVYQIGETTKSVAGSAVFVSVAVVSAAVGLMVFGPGTMGTAHLAGGAVVAGVLATVAEALGRRGWDNLWIVLAVIVPLSALDIRPSAVGLHLAALVVAGVFGVVAYRLRSLDLGGALAASLLAWMVVALGGPAWAAPAFTFFVLGSLLSRLGARRKADAERRAEKGSRRDLGQVVANGGVAGACLALAVFWPEPLLYGAFMGAFAAAAADTWATEVGTLARTARRLLVGPTVPPGTSGGMSLLGTAGAVGGSISVVGAALLTGGAPEAVGPWAFGLVGGGVAGSLLDSVLGATLQGRYRATDGTLTERRAEDGASLPLAAGRRWLDNDRVNLACTAAGAALGALVAMWL